MSLVMFWHEKKSPVWIIASLKDVCPLKSRKAVILFWLVKGNMVMSHDGARVWGSLADRQVFVFPFSFGLFVCFSALFCHWIQEQLFFTSECERTCFAVANKEMQNSRLWERRSGWNESEMLERLAAARLRADRSRCPLWFSHHATEPQRREFWRMSKREREGKWEKKVSLLSARSVSFGGWRRDAAAGRSRRQTEEKKRNNGGDERNTELCYQKGHRAERSQVRGTQVTLNNDLPSHYHLNLSHADLWCPWSPLTPVSNPSTWTLRPAWKLLLKQVFLLLSDD